MQAPKKVKAPLNNITPYLTPGKEYDVKSKKGNFFIVRDDVGTYLLCKEICCAHLNNQNWVILER